MDVPFTSTHNENRRDITGDPSDCTDTIIRKSGRIS